MLPFSVPVVVLLSLLVKEVCDSLLGNPSLTREKLQINTIKYRRICSVRLFYSSWVVLCEGRIWRRESILNFPILANPIRVKISLCRPTRQRGFWSHDFSCAFHWLHVLPRLPLEARLRLEFWLVHATFTKRTNRTVTIVLTCAFTRIKQKKTTFTFSKKRSSKHYLLTEVSIFSSQQLYFSLKAQNQLFFGILKKTNTKKNSISIKLLQIFSLSLQCEQGNKEIVLIYV